MLDFWSLETFFSLTHLWHEALGATALALGLAAGAQSCDRRLMWLMCGSALCWAGAYWQAGAAVAALCCVLAALRYVARLRLGASGTLLAFFILGHLGLSAWAYQGPRDLLPLAAVLIQCWGVFRWEGVRLRQAYLAGSFCWLLYSLLLGSIAGTVEEALFWLVVLATLWRGSRSRRAAKKSAAAQALAATTLCD